MGHVLTRLLLSRFKKYIILLVAIVTIISAVMLVSAVATVCSIIPGLQGQAGGQASDSTGGQTANQTGDVDGLPVSKNLITFLESWEGFSPTPYHGLDSWNATIGYGHVIAPGESFTSITEEEGEQLMISDLQNRGFISFVQKEFSDCNLAQNQFDALVSLAYNIGTGNWGRLNLTKDVNNGADAQTLKTDFCNIDHVGKMVSAGLLRRRQAEWQMYTQGVYVLN